eukprot:3748297-Pleurochrysis_carterae.AAC.1
MFLRDHWVRACTESAAALTSSPRARIMRAVGSACGICVCGSFREDSRSRAPIGELGSVEGMRICRSRRHVERERSSEVSSAASAR